MAIVRWDPFGEVLSLQKEMNRIFSRFGELEKDSNWMPKINMKSSEDSLMVQAELPGLNASDIDIEVNEGLLTLKGEKQTESKEEDDNWVIYESSYGKFERSIALPENIKLDDITADYNDGLLQINIPKTKELKAPKTTKILIGEKNNAGN